MIDKYNRRLNYLRVSITDHCNLRCIYCMSRDSVPKLLHKEILRYEEILRVIKAGVRLGISKVRITGGEPLVRRDICGFLSRLNAIDGLSDISLTTNGVLLLENIDKIKSAGIKRINISLDTLDRHKFKKITGHDFFQNVIEGIKRALELDFYPIKLNVVVLNGINDNEILDFARLTFFYPFQVRFIEYMPIGTACMSDRRHILAPEVKDHISVLGDLIPVEKGFDDGPAELFKFKGAKGEIGLIHPISRHFCATCNRLRLTASGRLMPCLLSDVYFDIKGPLRKGCSDNELADIFLNAAGNKPSSHHLAMNNQPPVPGRMSAIGG